MKKITIILFLLAAVSALFMVGCSNDDNTTIVAAATTQGWILGRVYLEPEVDFYADILPITNSTFVIDSIVSGDSLCTNNYNSFWYVYGDGNYDYVRYNNNADSLRYSSGDMFDITFYKDNSSTTTSLKLLDRQDDVPNYILPVVNDTISLGDELNITWNTVPNAEWYGIRIQYYRDSAGTYIDNQRYYLSIKDTTYNIPASTNIYNGYYRIYITAVTGPGAGDEPNINGIGLKGEIHSRSNTSSRQVYVGTGDPTQVGNYNNDENIDLNTIGEEIIKHIRNQPDIAKIEKQQF